MTSITNIYAHARTAVMRDYSARLEGNPSGIVLVAFSEPLNDVAKDALEKSFDAIGFGKGACTYANVQGLTAEDAFSLIEGTDPLALVATDAQAAGICAEAARQPFPLSRKLRLFGREARAFERLNGMFGGDADKQAVWHLLKTMNG